jgi:hypothetical protein
MVASLSRADHRMGLPTAQNDACDSIGAFEPVIVAQPFGIALNTTADIIASALCCGDLIRQRSRRGGCVEPAVP